jgi:DNA modification methylase
MNRVEVGDCRVTMRKWIAQGVKVQMCVTSPPYFGLRDYQVDGQLGLEATPADFVAAMVEVFGLVRELLADDGVLWLNLGDSYNAAGRTGHGTREGFKQSTNRASDTGADNCRPSVESLKPKDLIGIPWRVAFALQAAGWYLRQDIIWQKLNPMPESVTDRCTKAHEYIFLLSKSERYFYDHEAVKEPLSESSIGRAGRKQKLMDRSGVGTLGKQIVDGVNSAHAYAGLALGRNGKTGYNLEGGMRNRRSVWTVATKPYKGAHFATFPPALIEPCILAGSRPNDIVLDPFMGSGTSAQVAVQHGRQYLGCELNADYIPLQDERILRAKQSHQPDLFAA